MNAQVQLLTITPEQLKKFERDKKNLIDDTSCTRETLSQMSALFLTIKELAEKECNRSYRIGKLASLGQYMCDSWADSIDGIEMGLESLSPLNSPEA